MGARMATGPSKVEGSGTSISTTLDAFIRTGSDQLLRRLIYDLLSLSNVMLRNRGHFAAYIGVSDQQYMIMTLLNETPGVTVSQIARQFSVTSQFVTLETGKLIARGIVEKRDNPHDRRSVALTLTPRGQALLKEVWPMRRRTNDITFRSLTPQTAVQLREMIGALLLDAKTASHELESPLQSGQRSPLLDTAPPAAKPRAAPRKK
jgi:DNA-binding MarR family transcriptional regulator